MTTPHTEAPEPRRDHDPNHPYARTLKGCGHGRLFTEPCVDCEIVRLQEDYRHAARTLQRVGERLRALGERFNSPDADRITELEAANAQLDRDLSTALEERDMAQDALLEASMAMGGPEWCAKIPPEPAPDSGDLHQDVPELCRQLVAEKARLEAALATVQEDAQDAYRFRRWAEIVRDGEHTVLFFEACEVTAPNDRPSLDEMREAVDAGIKAVDAALRETAQPNTEQDS